jgi:hypothetical protein
MVAGSQPGPWRAAGTRTGVQLLLRPVQVVRGLLGRPFADPADDPIMLRRGHPVEVAAFRMEDGRSRHGLLVVVEERGRVRVAWRAWRLGRGFAPPDHPEPVVWRDGPPSRWRRLPRRLQPVDLVVADVHWVLAVPRHDVAFLREVLPDAS